MICVPFLFIWSNYSVTLEGGVQKKWLHHFFEHPRYPWAE
jgi:hypothetical protein